MTSPANGRMDRNEVSGSGFQLLTETRNLFLKPDTMSYDIDICVEDARWLAALPEVAAVCARACAAALDSCGVAAYAGEAGVAMLLTGDEQMQDLNRRYRDQDKPTNVLSFPQVVLHPEHLAVLAQDSRAHVPIILGDIALGYDTMAREAEAEGKTIADHTSHLVVHATLHLLGYDHLEERQAQAMEAKEAAILAALGVNDPYAALGGMI